MVGVIIIIVVFDAQAAGRAAQRAIVGPEKAKARVITRTYSAPGQADATPTQRAPRGGRPAEKTKGPPCGDPLLRSDFRIGAGEEIRTLDPNLGKVVLYH